MVIPKENALFQARPTQSKCPELCCISRLVYFKLVLFLPKGCVFIFCILFKWRGVKPTSMSNKTCRTWNFWLCLSQKKRERGAKTSNFKNTIFKTPEKLLLVTLVTNYHKLSLLPFVVRPWQKFLKN